MMALKQPWRQLSECTYSVIHPLNFMLGIQFICMILLMKPIEQYITVTLLYYSVSSPLVGETPALNQSIESH